MQTGNGQEETLSLKGAGKGTYRVLFHADGATEEGTTLGSVEIESSECGQLASFAPSRLMNSAGEEECFELAICE